MDDSHEPLPWDYFLTNYEKDLLRLPIEEAVQKYPRMAFEQMQEDRDALLWVIACQEPE